MIFMITVAIVRILWAGIKIFGTTIIYYWKRMVVERRKYPDIGIENTVFTVEKDNFMKTSSVHHANTLQLNFERNFIPVLNANPYLPGMISEDMDYGTNISEKTEEDLLPLKTVSLNNKLANKRSYCSYRLTSSVQMKNHPLKKSTNGYKTESCEEIHDKDTHTINRKQFSVLSLENKHRLRSKSKEVKFQSSTCSIDNVYKEGKLSTSTNDVRSGDFNAEVLDKKNFSPLKIGKEGELFEGKDNVPTLIKINPVLSQIANNHNDVTSYLEDLIRNINSISKSKKILCLKNGELVLCDRGISNECNTDNKVKFIPEGHVTASGLMQIEADVSSNLCKSISKDRKLTFDAHNIHEGISQNVILTQGLANRCLEKEELFSKCDSNQLINLKSSQKFQDKTKEKLDTKSAIMTCSTMKTNKENTKLKKDELFSNHDSNLLVNFGSPFEFQDRPIKKLEVLLANKTYSTLTTNSENISPFGDSLITINLNNYKLRRYSDLWLCKEHSDVSISTVQSKSDEYSRLSATNFELNAKKGYDDIVVTNRNLPDNLKNSKHMIGCCPDCIPKPYSCKYIVYNIHLEGNSETNMFEKNIGESFLKNESRVFESPEQKTEKTESIFESTLSNSQPRCSEIGKRDHLSSSSNPLAYGLHKSVFKKFNPRSLLLFQTSVPKKCIQPRESCKKIDKSSEILQENRSREFLSKKDFKELKKESRDEEIPLMSCENKSSESLIGKSFVKYSNLSSSLDWQKFCDRSFKTESSNSCGTDDCQEAVEDTQLMNTQKYVHSKLEAFSRHGESFMNYWTHNRKKTEARKSIRKPYNKFKND